MNLRWKENPALQQVLLGCLLLLFLLVFFRVIGLIGSSGSVLDLFARANSTRTAIALTSDALLGPFPTPTGPTPTASRTPTDTPTPTITPSATPSPTRIRYFINTGTPRTLVPGVSGTLTAQVPVGTKTSSPPTNPPSQPTDPPVQPTNPPQPTNLPQPTNPPQPTSPPQPTDPPAQPTDKPKKPTKTSKPPKPTKPPKSTKTPKKYPPMGCVTPLNCTYFLSEKDLELYNSSGFSDIRLFRFSLNRELVKPDNYVKSYPLFLTYD